MSIKYTGVRNDKAKNIRVEDVDGNFTGTNVEEVLKELDTNVKDMENKVTKGDSYTSSSFPSSIFDKITKWNALGDSITEGMSTDKIYHEYIADTYNNLTVRNYGKSSTEICKGGTFPNPFCERYAQMDNDADLVTVFGGVNDYGHNAPIGTFSVRDDATFYGGLRTLIEGLRQKYPSQLIYFFTPLKSRGCGNKNTQGKTLEDYVNVIKEVCNYYSIPCVDLYNVSGLNPNIDFVNTTYFADGLHPNKDGHLVLARSLTYISSTATNVKIKNITETTGTPTGGNIYKVATGEYTQNSNSGFWHSDGYFVESSSYHTAKVNLEPGGTYELLYNGVAFNHQLYITFVNGTTFVKQVEKNLNSTVYRFPNDISYDTVCICNLDGMDFDKISIRAIANTGTTPGEDTGKYYTVTKNLTNCTLSNSASSILENTAYSTTINPNSNYTVKTITVTMGGVDITSTVVSDKTISITKVTGNIVITATAEANPAGTISKPTPLAGTDIGTVTGDNIYDGSQYKVNGNSGYYTNSLSWDNSNDYVSTNIPVTPGGKYEILYNGAALNKNVFLTLIKDTTPVKYFDMKIDNTKYQFPNDIDFNICAIVTLDKLDFSKYSVKVIK